MAHGSGFDYLSWTLRIQLIALGFIFYAVVFLLSHFLSVLLFRTYRDLPAREKVRGFSAHVFCFSVGDITFSFHICRCSGLWRRRGRCLVCRAWWRVSGRSWRTGRSLMIRSWDRQTGRGLTFWRPAASLCLRIWLCTDPTSCFESSTPPWPCTTPSPWRGTRAPCCGTRWVTSWPWWHCCWRWAHPSPASPGCSSRWERTPELLLFICLSVCLSSFLFVFLLSLLILLFMIICICVFLTVFFVCYIFYFLLSYVFFSLLTLSYTNLPLNDEKKTI